MTNKKILLVPALCLTLQALAQSNQFNSAVYFETGQHFIGQKDSAALEELAQKLKNTPDYELNISAYTDDRGSEEDNQALAARRSESVINFLQRRNLPLPSRQVVIPVGEIALGKNKNIEEARRQNRRVDVSISTFAPQNIGDVFNYFQERNKTNFKYNSAKDTVLIGQKGTMLSIPADAFSAADGNVKIQYPVTVELREAYSFGDMLANNVSTVSDGKLIQTGGMVYIGAKDANGTELKLAAGKEIQVGMPANGKLPEGMQLFTANRSGSDNNSATNWKPQEQAFTQFDMQYYYQTSKRETPNLSKLNVELYTPLYAEAKYPDTLYFEQPAIPQKPQLATVKAIEPTMESIQTQFPRGKKEKLTEYEARVKKQYDSQVKNYNKKLAERQQRQREFETATQKYEADVVKYNQQMVLYKNSRQAAFDYFTAICQGGKNSTFYKFYQQHKDVQEARVNLAKRIKSPVDDIRQLDYFIYLCQSNQLTDLKKEAQKLKKELLNVGTTSDAWSSAHKKAAGELFTISKQAGFDESRVSFNYDRNNSNKNINTNFYYTVLFNVNRDSLWSLGFDLTQRENEVLYAIQSFQKNVMSKSTAENCQTLTAFNSKIEKLQKMGIDSTAYNKQKDLINKINNALTEKYIVKANAWLDRMETAMAQITSINSQNISLWNNFYRNLSTIKYANLKNDALQTRYSSMQAQFDQKTNALLGTFANSSFLSIENNLQIAESDTTFDVKILSREISSCYQFSYLFPFQSEFYNRFQSINRRYYQVCERAKIASARNNLNNLKNVDANALNTVAQNLTTISNLGWVNCDRFYNEKDLIHTNIMVEANPEDKCYLVFTELNVIVPMEVANNKFITPAAYQGVPANAKVKVIGMRANKGEMQTFVFEDMAKNINQQRPVFVKSKISDLVNLFENI